MSTRKLSNVKLSDYREFLSKAGCKLNRTDGGHEIWSKKELTRPIVIQTHIEPVPEFIIKNALRTLGLKKKDFFEILFDCKVEESDFTEDEKIEIPDNL